MGKNVSIVGQDSTNTITTSDGGTKPAYSAVKVTNNAIHAYDATLRSGEDQTLGVQGVAYSANTAVSVTRTTSDANIGNATAGDYLHRVIVTSATIPTTALTISDGAGTVVCHIPGATAAGTVIDVECTATTSGFVVDLDASNAGTVTCIGIFQA